MTLGRCTISVNSGISRGAVVKGHAGEWGDDEHGKRNWWRSVEVGSIWKRIVGTKREFEIRSIDWKARRVTLGQVGKDESWSERLQNLYEYYEEVK